MSRIEPKMFPEDPQKKGTEVIDSTDSTAINQSNGELNIDKLYPDTRPPVVQFESPYNINGGGFMKQYHFMSKPGEFPIKGRNLIDALKNGLSKLENQNRDIYNQKKQITVNLQRKSNNRENKLHKYMVKIFRIDHPVYRYKIELWKL
jgi:uncharacterized protein YifE (UPF0438 family)